MTPQRHKYRLFFSFIHEVIHPTSPSSHPTDIHTPLPILPSPPSETKPNLMNSSRPIIIITSPTNKTPTLPLIHHKKQLRGNLRPQKHRLLKPMILPLRKILWELNQLQTRWSLAVRMVAAVLHSRGTEASVLLAVVEGGGDGLVWV